MDLVGSIIRESHTSLIRYACTLQDLEKASLKSNLKYKFKLVCDGPVITLTQQELYQNQLQIKKKNCFKGIEWKITAFKISLK